MQNIQQRIGQTILLLSIVCLASEVRAQQINTSTPFIGVSDSYFERMGVNFGFSIPGGRGNGSRIVGWNGVNTTPNINFNQNGFGSAVPPFGGYDPNASARFGFSRVNPGGGGFSLGFEFGKGSTRTLTSTTPSLTTQNGFGGSIGNGSFRPFVTGVIPVVSNNGSNFDPYGGRVAALPAPRTNAVTAAIQSGQLNLGGPVQNAEPSYDGPISYANENSTANQSDISVAAIKARRAAAESRARVQLEKLLEDAAIYTAKKDYRMARNSIREALKLNEDNVLEAELKLKLKELRGK